LTLRGGPGVPCDVDPAGRRHLLQREVPERSAPMRARELMTQPVVTVRRDASLAQVARTMVARHDFLRMIAGGGHRA
jgi:CBS domain-containing protein